jgi:hypothetical protein
MPLESRIHIEVFPLIVPHPAHIFRIVRSDDMPRSIIEGAVCATAKFGKCADSSVQMTYEVLTRVLKLFCLTSETIWIICWDIDAVRSLAPQTVDPHNNG